MDEHEWLSNITLQHKIQIKVMKKNCFYWPSTFHSHSRAFNNEHNLYHKMSVKRPLVACSWLALCLQLSGPLPAVERPFACSWAALCLQLNGPCLQLSGPLPAVERYFLFLLINITSGYFCHFDVIYHLVHGICLGNFL
jgi:hypothetical protein